MDSSVASFVSAPFCPTSPPREIPRASVSFFNKPVLKDELEGASPAKLRLLCGKYAAESAAFEVLADEYKEKLDKLEADQANQLTELTNRLDRNEYHLTRIVFLLTEAHERIEHLCETVESFEQEQGLDPEQEY